MAHIQEVHPDANLVFVGHSEGGTVATRWAVDRQRADRRAPVYPIITLDSMPYGFWPEDRSTPDVDEDVDNYCGGTGGGNVAAGIEDLPGGD